jgi:hypothetical protein
MCVTFLAIIGVAWTLGSAESHHRNSRRLRHKARKRVARAAARKLLLRGPGRVGPGRGAETWCEGAGGKALVSRP